jgi:hypothetical protein
VQAAVAQASFADHYAHAAVSAPEARSIPQQSRKPRFTATSRASWAFDKLGDLSRDWGYCSWQ